MTKKTTKKTFPQPPPFPESRFIIYGVSCWPFDNTRATGTWSERNNADVYGQTPAFIRKLFSIFEKGSNKG